MKYEVETNSFELKDIFECGQCFRWNEENNKSYTGIFTDCVINVEKQGTKITFKGKCCNEITQKEFEEKVQKYFDLNRDYSKIKSILSKVDENLKLSVEYGDGIRILNQDLWETIISFIISANNNIPRIKGIIERISKQYGKEIEFEGNKYYTFPSKEELSKASVEDLRALGLGFRDVRVYETTKIILNNEIDLEELHNIPTNEVRDKLLGLPRSWTKSCRLHFIIFNIKEI